MTTGNGLLDVCVPLPLNAQLICLPQAMLRFSELVGEILLSKNAQRLSITGNSQLQVVTLNPHIALPGSSASRDLYTCILVWITCQCVDLQRFLTRKQRALHMLRSLSAEMFQVCDRQLIL
jgi:hypothetical protein